MAYIKGRSQVSAHIQGISENLRLVMRGAARAGGKVFLDYIEENTPSDEVKKALRLRTKTDAGHVKATVDLKPGWGRSIGNWLEYGTDAHFISVDDSQRNGRSIGRINQQLRQPDASASLVIGGTFIGKTVFHPGARAHPTFRPARDLKEADAVNAAQSYINARLSRKGIVGGDEGGDDE